MKSRCSSSNRQNKSVFGVADPVSRLLRTGGIAGLALLAAVPARSETSRASSKEDPACTTAYAGAQEREQSGHLIAARDLWLACAKPSCGNFLHQECSVRYSQLNSDIPSIVPLASDASGAPLLDVEVKVDGEPFATKLDGRALPIDPGLHEFAFSNAGGVFAKQSVMVVQGQRNRPIAASLQGAEKGARKVALAAGGEAAADAPAADAPLVARHEEQPLPLHRRLTYGLVGGGLAAMGSFGLLTYWGRKDNDKLTQCAPNCASASVDHIRKLYLAANISLGVGIAALGAAYWVLAIARSESEEKATESAYRFDVQPARSGGLATLSGSF
jgi:hypothetical protein